jgi:hypothetical protein
MSSYGSWRMTGADYLAFFDQFGPAAAALGTKTRDWMLDKTGKLYGNTVIRLGMASASVFETLASGSKSQGGRGSAWS